MSDRKGVGVEVNIEGLTRRFEKGGQTIYVLNDVTIRFNPGERVAVVGPSGSGKSTFLQILGTLDSPTEGTVRLDDRDVFKLPRKDLDRLRNQQIGFVFQFHHLLPDQTAQGNVALPMIIKGMRKAEAFEVAAERLGKVGLAARLTHLPGELSGGEQQRVAIARAMVMSPGLLLADEPTGNLDPKTAEGVLEILLQLNEEQGSTLVVVTHSRDLAARFPRRLEVREGKLMELT